MAKKSDIVATTQEESRVIDLLAQGLSVAQVAKATGLQQKVVNGYYDKWLAIQHDQFAELMEMTALRSMGRLEHMYGTIAETFYDQMAMETDEGDPMPVFDKSMADMMLKVMKEQREWVKMRIDAGKSRDDGARTVNVDTMNVTMTGKDPLYETARMNIVEEAEADWLQYADAEVDDIYLSEQTTPTKDKIDEKLDKLAQVINPDGESGED